MTVTIRNRGGITFDLASGQRVVADGTYQHADTAVVSHAHVDHLIRDRQTPTICSDQTARLASVRLERQVESARPPDDGFELVNAGHVPGSRCLRIQDDDASILYTGDISTRDRFYLDGFEPVDADHLVIESTYGTPDYVFPSQVDIEHAIVDWFDDTLGTPLVLVGYALGRAQELELLVNRSNRDGLYVSPAIEAMNEVIEAEYDVSFGADVVNEGVAVSGEDVLIIPSRSRAGDLLDSVAETDEYKTAGFSGWAVDSSYKYANNYDRTFPLSDHCDYEELLAVVEAVDPAQVYTTHGSADAFASHVTAELGIAARSLKRDQHTLADFRSG